MKHTLKIREFIKLLKVLFSRVLIHIQYLYFNTMAEQNKRYFILIKISQYFKQTNLGVFHLNLHTICFRYIFVLLHLLFSNTHLLSFYHEKFV